MSDLKYSEISSILKEELSDFQFESKLSEYGIVVQVGDGVVRSFGLNSAFYGELVEFKGGEKGIVLNLEEDHVSIVLLHSYKNIKEGDTVKRTKKTFSIKVGENLLGRVIDILGNPIDGKGPIDNGESFEMPIERKAPGVIYREPVKEPLQTGIKFIDSMIPIGKGQRELIIGDRQTGKTTIAIDTIINQKKFFENKNPVYCIYVAISQKGSTIAKIAKILEDNQALSYTVIVAATSSEPAPIQVFAPFSGTAIGEYFRDTGRSSLIVYDDLSKQAVSYREISLLLRRPPGREAYPGDVFYLHSRLLERSAKIIKDQKMVEKMNDIPESIRKKVKGGGSLTAIPIIETQSGDISSYIPTNVISITDGQIFLEKELFNSGIRPAINESISVSRVGGSAQIKSMREIASTLKIDQAQFRELESFSKFGSELDPSTMETIKRGKINIEILKQLPQTPYDIAEQIAIIYVGTKNLLKNIPIEKISLFEKDYLFYLKEKHQDLLDHIRKGFFKKEYHKIIEKIVLELSNKYIN